MRLSDAIERTGMPEGHTRPRVDPSKDRCKWCDGYGGSELPDHSLRVCARCNGRGTEKPLHDEFAREDELAELKEKRLMPSEIPHHIPDPRRALLELGWAELSDHDVRLEPSNQLDLFGESE